MLQKDELFPWRTIEKNVFLPLEIQRCNTPERRQKVLSLAEKYGLKDFLKSFPRELSGGMRQRAALIRTLAAEPDVLLLDEPFSALDYQTRLNVCDDVYRIIKSEKKTAVLITHDISEAVSVADEAIVLSRRPATLVAEYTLPFGEETPLKRRENPAFSPVVRTALEGFERMKKNVYTKEHLLYLASVRRKNIADHLRPRADSFRPARHMGTRRAV